MTDTIDTARARYNATGLTERIRDALLKIAPVEQRLTVADIAAMDQFHTRGMLATRDLAALTSIGPDTRVLDLGCGIGGPARFLAATFGCRVIGLDLSESFIDAAQYLTDRCAMRDLVSFQVGNALAIPFEAKSFDVVFLQHVAMNIQDRAGLYAEIARVLAPAGRLATYDVILSSRRASILWPGATTARWPWPGFAAVRDALERLNATRPLAHLNQSDFPATVGAFHSVALSLPGSPSR